MVLVWDSLIAMAKCHFGASHRFYIYCRKIYNLFVPALETGWNASLWWNFLSHFAAIAEGPSWSCSYIWYVGFATTQAISAYHHRCCEFESRSGRGVQHYVIKFVSDLRQVSGFLRVLRFPPLIKKTDRHDITEILLKVTLKTITLTLKRGSIHTDFAMTGQETKPNQTNWTFILSDNVGILYYFLQCQKAHFF